jgi:hypothetical protein
MNLVLTLYFALILPGEPSRIVAFEVEPTDPGRHVTWENCKQTGEEAAAAMLKDHPMLAAHLRLRNVQCAVPESLQPKINT